MTARDRGISPRVCPTCHTDDGVHFIWSAGNVLRLVGNLVCGLVTTLFALIWVPFHVHWECQRCGAEFEARRVSTERVCYRCGLPIGHLPTPLRSCPACKAPLTQPDKSDDESDDQPGGQQAPK